MRFKHAFVLLVIVSPGGYSTAQAAQRFVMPGTTYSVSLPGSPECKQTTEDTPAGHIQRHSCTYFNEKLGGGYVFEYFSLPAAPLMGSEQAILHGAAAGAAQATGSEIVREWEIEIGGFPAREVLLLTKSRGLLARVRYVLVKNNVVTVSVDGGRKIHSSPEAAEYLKSLEVSASAPLDAPNNSIRDSPSTARE